MTRAWFATFRGGAVSAADVAWLERSLAAVPGLTRGLIFTPAAAHDPYLHDGEPPTLALELYFADDAALRYALAGGGGLEPVAAADALPSLRGSAVTQQAMAVRSFSVPDARFRTPPNQAWCTYLVAYEGEADDLDAWVAHYVTHHTAIMARFPGIREVEVATRIDWVSALPWPRADAMLRNKVVFDSADSLTAALNSPVRHEMRADFARFPPFRGPVTHFPMATRAVRM